MENFKKSWLVVCSVFLTMASVHCHAEILDSWHWKNPSPFSDTMRHIVFANGKFVAVGDGGVVHTSVNGSSWDEGRRPVTSTLNRIIYADGQFIAVGSEGTIITSVDAVNWELQSSGATNDLLAIAHGNGIYIACGRSGQVAISTNRISWSLTNAGTSDLNWITFGNGLFIMPVPGSPGQEVKVTISKDGQTWTDSPSFPIPGATWPHVLHQAEFGNGKFVAIVSDEEMNAGISNSPSCHYYWSTDATNWLRGAKSPKGPFYNGGHRFLAFANGSFNEFTASNFDLSLNYIARSLNGTDCETLSAPSDAFDATGMAFGDGRYVLMGNQGKCWISTNAVDWASGYGGFRDDVYEIIQGSNGYVLASSTHILTSSDGLNFTPATNSPLGILTSVAFDGSNYVAVGTSGGFPQATVGEVYTSTNSIDWVRRTSNTDKPLGAICAGPARWIAVGQSGTIVTSPNTLVWTLRASGTGNNLNSVAVGNGIYVAVGDMGTLVTSPDGTTWDAQFSGTTANLARVRFLNGQFFAVGANETILVSTNGSTWLGVNSGGTAAFRDVEYGNERYVACGFGDTFGTSTNIFFQSTNGVHWQDITTKVPTAANPVGIAYLNQSFWIVGDNGLILQSDNADGIPRLKGSLLSGNAGFELRVLSNIPDVYRIQISTNLMLNAWEDAVSVSNSTPAVWIDTNAINSSIRMYRLVSP